jgi:YggT family protein
MQNALVFVVSTLLDLLVIAFILRLVLGWVRADFRNPLAQLIIKVTNPLVIPARRIIPPAGSFDTATLIVLLALQTGATAILMQLSCIGAPQVDQVFVLGLLRLVHVVLNVYFWLLIIYVLSSWLAPGGYNPALALLSKVVEPLLAPLRRVIPVIAGLDLSPIAAFLIIGFLERLIPARIPLAGLVCVPF